jgi:hypothetical protein
MTFGTVIGIDYVPGLRAMVLCPRTKDGLLTLAPRIEWYAVVLRDDEREWDVGRVVTVAADVAGLVIFEEGA